MTVSDSVLLQVALGDNAAARRCIDQFGSLVWSIARRHSPSEADAEDAVQDIFLSLWKSASRFDPSRSSEAGFVAMIARRRLIDLTRMRACRDPATLPVDAEANVRPANAATGRLESQRMEQALAALRPEQRAVLLMSTVEGFSQGEIAEKTGMPLGTVKVHARRGLLRLRELFFGPNEAPARIDLQAPVTARASREEMER